MNDTAQMVLRLDGVVLLCNDGSHVIRLCLVISCQSYPDLARTFFHLDNLQPINSHLLRTPPPPTPPSQHPYHARTKTTHKNSTSIYRTPTIRHPRRRPSICPYLCPRSSTPSARRSRWSTGWRLRRHALSRRSHDGTATRKG